MKVQFNNSVFLFQKVQKISIKVSIMDKKQQRKIKNRQSARRYRQRKLNYIKSLEERCDRMEQMTNVLVDIFFHLQMELLSKVETHDELAKWSNLLIKAGLLLARLYNITQSSSRGSDRRGDTHSSRDLSSHEDFVCTG